MMLVGWTDFRFLTSSTTTFGGLACQDTGRPTSIWKERMTSDFESAVTWDSSTSSPRDRELWERLGDPSVWGNSSKVRDMYSHQPDTVLNQCKINT